MDKILRLFGIVSLLTIGISGQVFNPRPVRPPFGPPLPYNGNFVPILEYTNEHNPDSSYRYSYVTADGKQAEERGFLKDVVVDNLGEAYGTQVAIGSYSYTAPDGTPVEVSYVADEKGFQPIVRVAGNGPVNRPIPGNFPGNYPRNFRP